MKRWLTASVRLATLVLAGALLAGALLGNMLAWLLAASVLLHLRFWYQARHLFNWAENPLARPEQETLPGTI